MKDRSAKRKVVVRHLPPSLSQPDLLSQIDSRFGDSYSWFSFRPGKSNYKTQKHSRAYFGFKSPEDVYEFAAFFNGHVFVNEKGAQFKAIVEYAPSQRVPKPCDKKDPREGSITKDPEYLEFLKLIAQPVENLPSAEVQLERREAEQSGASKPAPIVTPLMEFIRQKRATVIGSQGSLDVRRGGRRSRAVSANKPSSRPSKRISEKKKYVEKDNSKSVRSSKQDNSSTASVMDSSLPGISLIMESGKKKILLLKKDRDTPVNSPPQPEQQMETNLSSTSRQNQKIDDVGGRLIKGMLVRKEPRPSQSSTLVQPEPRVEPSEAENYKRPPRADGIYAGKDYHVSGTNTEKQERRPRNRDRPDRVVWAPLRRSDGSNNCEDQPLPSAANNGEVKQRTLLQRSGEVVNSSDGHSLENGSGKYSSRRVGSRNRKEDGFAVTGEGKSSRRGGGGDPTSYEASQARWIQKSSSGYKHQPIPMEFVFERESIHLNGNGK
ncbi:BnaA08g06560D [Brassica napus]|uniref:BnaA08g06560D protein n=1 Tax=Brassica napus TaxID=3708 RepID=A0A078I8N9_BRANA|nr:BnaA08g06560D [Brassica napus]